MDSIHIRVPGIMSLEFDIQPYEDGRVDFDGRIAFALSRTINNALRVLPFGMGKRIGDALIKRRLEGQRFTLNVSGISEVTTTTEDDGLFTIKADYATSLAHPVTYGELCTIFDQFAANMETAGIVPSIQPEVDRFLKDFKKNKEAQLHFSQMFTGKRLEHEGVPNTPIKDFLISDVAVYQDGEGDLGVSFKAKGQLAEPLQ